MCILIFQNLLKNSTLYQSHQPQYPLFLFISLGLPVNFVYFAVGTTWDKDFRVVLVLSTLKMDQQFDKNAEFYVPAEQVNQWKKWKIHDRTHPLTWIHFIFSALWIRNLSHLFSFFLFLLFPVASSHKLHSWLGQHVDISGPSYFSL